MIISETEAAIREIVEEYLRFAEDNYIRVTNNFTLRDLYRLYKLEVKDVIKDEYLATYQQFEEYYNMYYEMTN